MIGVQEALLASCVLPSCSNVVAEAGDACGDCQAFWGPFLGRHGDLSAWHPGYVPACHHGFNWWNPAAGRCGRCGCTKTLDVDERAG